MIVSLLGWTIACAPFQPALPEGKLELEDLNSDTGVFDESDTGWTEGEPSQELPTYIDPFVIEEDQSAGLTNTSPILEAVLEYGALEDACELYAQYPNDEALKLRCGKAMFFYEGFGGIGIPQPLFDFVNRKFTDELGEGMAEYGMILDPYSEEKRPIGYGPGASMGSVDTLAYSCASCHFGQLPDGRYSVGMANYDYEAGKQFLALMLLPQSVMPGFNDDDHDPEALNIIQPLRQKLWNNPLLFAQMGWDLLPLLWESDMSAGQVTQEVEAAYASWKSGTMDVFLPPLPIDDEVHVVSKIPTLWNIPNAAEQEAFGMDDAMLSWIGTSGSLEHFVGGFLALSASEDWTVEDVEPLIAYVESLQAPKTIESINNRSANDGEGIFQEVGCLECHQGYQGSGNRLFDYDEIQTDDQMRYILDPDQDGQVVSGVNAHTTHQIKAPRLTGVWAKKRLLHNGSVDSLEELLCIGSDRTDDTPVFGNVGHWYGCDLELQEKLDVIEFLKSI